MELDDFKSAWKTVPNEKKYNKDAIFEMLKKNSSSTVKWLFIFTFIEFIFVLIFIISSIIKGKLLTGENLTLENSTAYFNFIVGTIFTLIFTVLFLFFNYKTYKKININKSTKELIEQITKFRKLVNLFILFILIALIAVSIPYYYQLGMNIYIEKAGINFDHTKAQTIGYIAVALAIVFLLIITTIYYSFIHWFFLRKLSKNLKDLNEIN